MEYILGPRGSGKTTTLVHMSAESGYIIVCKNYKMIRHIRDLARMMQVDIPSPITYDILMETSYGRGIVIPGVMIDDLSSFMMYLIGHFPIMAASDTPDGVTLLDNPYPPNLLDNLTSGFSTELDGV